MSDPKWRETTVELPIASAREELTNTPVRFRGEFVQVWEARDFELPENQNLIAWLAAINELADTLEDATITYAEPFHGGTVSDISLVVTGWRWPNELEQEILFPMLPKPE